MMELLSPLPTGRRYSFLVMPAPIILIVDDEPQVRRVVREALATVTAETVEAATAATATELTVSRRPDVIVLDLGLPDGDGLAVCREIRRWSETPIIVLSARSDESAKVALLDAGADDYVTKPFGTAELTARVRTQLRRAHWAGALSRDPVVRVGTLVIDLRCRTVDRAGVSVHLTPLEWALLRTFVTHPCRTLTHRQLFQAAWQREHGNAQQYLRVYLTSLRRKIERDPAAPTLIVTEPGVGYRFEPESSA
jgi:two-component system, OmpR family, KDP operon response regulator KdpE